MSISRRVSFLGFALVPLLVLAACGGNGGEDDAQVELPAPGEYFFDVEATIEFTLTQPTVSAAAAGEVQIYSGQGMGSTGFTFARPGGVEEIIGRFGGMEIAVDILHGDDGFQITVTQRPDEESPLIKGTEREGTLASLFFEFQLPADRIPGDGEGTSTLINVDPLLLGSVRPLGLTEPFTLLGPNGYGPVPLTDDAGQTVGEITAFDLTLNPVDGQVQDGAGEEPATDESVLDFSDPQDDATDCVTGEAVVDPAVDIDKVTVKKMGETIEVEVGPVQAPETSLEDFSFSIILTLADFSAVTENHAGLLQEGLIDSSGSIIPGSEGHVTWTDGGVTFNIPDGDSIPKGSLLDVAAFHTGVEGGNVNCDTFMAEYTCFGRCDD